MFFLVFMNIAFIGLSHGMYGAGRLEGAYRPSAARVGAGSAGSVPRLQLEQERASRAGFGHLLSSHGLGTRSYDHSSAYGLGSMDWQGPASPRAAYGLGYGAGFYDAVSLGAPISLAAVRPASAPSTGRAGSPSSSGNYGGSASPRRACPIFS